jgi:hypothetical protein
VGQRIGLSSSRSATRRGKHRDAVQFSLYSKEEFAATTPVCTVKFYRRVVVSVLFCPNAAHEGPTMVPVKWSKRSKLEPGQSIRIRENSIIHHDNKDRGALAVVTPL